MQKRTGSKGRRVVAAACAVAMALAVAVTPAHAAPARRAAPVSTQGVAHVNGDIGWVPTHRYTVFYANGDIAHFKDDEKQISLPAGYRIANGRWRTDSERDDLYRFPGAIKVITETYVYDIVKK